MIKINGQVYINNKHNTGLFIKYAYPLFLLKYRSSMIWRVLMAILTILTILTIFAIFAILTILPHPLSPDHTCTRYIFSLSLTSPPATRSSRNRYIYLLYIYINHTHHRSTYYILFAYIFYHFNYTLIM